MNRRAFWTGVYAVAVCAPAAAQDPEADAVIKKAIQAHGGADALSASPAGRVVSEGAITVGGEEKPFRLIESYHLPGRSRIELITKVDGLDVNLVQVVTDKKAQQRLNEQEFTLSEEARRDLSAAAAMQEIYRLTPLLDRGKFSLKLLKTDFDVAGRRCAGVQVRAKGVPPLKLYFDKATGLLAGVERRGRGPAGQTVNLKAVLSENKVFNGVKRATVREIYADDRKYMTQRVKSWEDRKSLPAATFTLAGD